MQIIMAVYCRPKSGLTADVLLYVVMQFCSHSVVVAAQLGTPLARAQFFAQAWANVIADVPVAPPAAGTPPVEVAPPVVAEPPASGASPVALAPYSSADQFKPTMSTLPTGNKVAVWYSLRAIMLPVAENVPASGSYSSALAKTTNSFVPPAMSTFPSSNIVAV
jgi:hypothetical protein